jgi:hypothetical protein
VYLKCSDFKNLLIFFHTIQEKTRDENPTGPGFGAGPKTLIFLNFKNPEHGPKHECDFPETLNPNPNPKFKNLGPAENPVQFFYKTEIRK